MNFFSILWLCLCLSSVTWGQVTSSDSLRNRSSGDASIYGVVTDPHSDRVPFALIVLTHEHGDVLRATTSGPFGTYAVSGLMPGNYMLRVSSSVTASFDIPVTISGAREFPLSLAPAVFQPSRKNALWLPESYLRDLRSRSWITSGQPGGDVESYGPYGSRGAFAFNFAGQRSQGNSFTIDGTDNNDVWNRSVAVIPPSNSIAEVMPVLSQLTAEFGRASGTVFRSGTPRGTDEFHGAFSESFRNSAIAARNFFDGDKPNSLGNQFAGSAGKGFGNGWYVFGAAEGVLQRNGLTVVSTMPSIAERSGDFGDRAIYDPITADCCDPRSRQPFPGNRIPAERISRQGQNLVALLPLPNLPGTINNFRFTPSAIDNVGRYVARVDRHISETQAFFTRWNFDNGTHKAPGSMPAPVNNSFPSGSFTGSEVSQHADASRTEHHAWSGMLSYTWQARPSVTNELRGGWTVLQLRSEAADANLNSSAILGIPGLSSEGLPSVSLSGYASLGSAGPTPLRIRTTAFELADSLSWTSPHHAWRFGAQFVTRRAGGDAGEWTSRSTYFFTPDYTSLPGVAGTGSAIASLLLGYPTEIRRDLMFADFQLRGKEFGLWAVDQFRVGSRLTLEIGMRYSLLPPLTEANDHLVNFNFSRSQPALDVFAGVNGVNRFAGIENNYWAFAPHIGFALRLSADGATILRGGFNQNYDAGTYLTQGRLARNQPFGSRLDIINSTYQPGADLSQGLPAPVRLTDLGAASLNTAQAAVYAAEPESSTPYADHWSLTLQRSFGSKLVAEISGNGCVHWFESFDANQPLPFPLSYLDPAPRHPYDPYRSRLDYLNTGGGSTYYGGHGRLRVRALRGFQLLAEYSYAKSLDDAAAPGTAPEARPTYPPYLYNPRSNRSVSSFDIAHRAVVTASYEVPSDVLGTQGVLTNLVSRWDISTQIMMQTGLPFTPQLAVNSLSDGGYQLPDRIGSGELPSDQHSYLRWFNTSLSPTDPNRAFQIPALFHYGTSGLNILRGPGLATVDATLARTFRLHEGLQLQAGAQAFNLLNRANFALPNRILDVPTAGVINHTIQTSRQFRLVAALQW
jgi:hypothetical protein